MPKSGWTVRLLIIGSLLVVAIAIVVWGPSFSSDNNQTVSDSEKTPTPVAGNNGPPKGGQDVANVKDQVDFIIKDSSGREKQSGSLGN